MKKFCHHQLPIPIRAHLASAMSSDVDAATVAENKRLKMMLDQLQEALKQKDKTIDDQRDELKQKRVNSTKKTVNSTKKTVNSIFPDG